MCSKNAPHLLYIYSYGENLYWIMWGLQKSISCTKCNCTIHSWEIWNLLAHRWNCFLVLKLAKTIGVCQRLHEDLRKLLFLLCTLILCLAMLQQHVNLRNKQRLCILKLCIKTVPVFQLTWKTVLLGDLQSDNSFQFARTNATLFQVTW